MKQHEAIEKYLFSKTNIQLTTASLETLKVVKHIPDITTNLHNEISFGKGMSPVKNNEIEAFLRVLIESKSSWDGPTVIETEMIYKGVFQSKEQIESDDFINWTDVQVVPQLVPYARGLIASISTQMMIEPIILPTMDIIQSIIENEEAEKEE